MADLLDHGGDVGIAGWLTREKARREALVGAIEIDPLEEDAMERRFRLMALPKRWINVTDPDWMLARAQPRVTALFT